MKKKLLLFILLFGTMTAVTKAQVKIGDNPNTINSNSLLELESANKGILFPRMAINDVTLPAPMTGTVPAGMVVYSSGGAVADGMYCWNGHQWAQIPTVENVRANYKVIAHETDFPAPVGGVITLAPATVYEINGTVTLTNKIDLNGSTIIGKDRGNDILLYTPASGEMFTGSNGGNLYNLTLSATGAGSKLFNLDAAGDPSKTLIAEFVYIFNNDNIGIIQNFAGFVVFNNSAYSNNANGVTLQNIGDYIALNDFWIADNHNTYHTLVGSFNTVLVSGGKNHVLSAFSARGFDVSGITSITTGAELKNTLFVGDGTYVVGTFSKEWEVESNGLNTEKDDVASGNIYISTAAATTFTAINTPKKVNGTTTTASLFRVTSPVSNRLVYDGSKSKRFQVICSLSLVAAGSNKNFSFYFAKNGVILPESRQSLKMGSSSDKGSITLSCTSQLQPNDYIEVWVENNTDATSVTIETFNLAVK